MDPEVGGGSRARRRAFQERRGLASPKRDIVARRRDGVSDWRRSGRSGAADAEGAQNSRQADVVLHDDLLTPGNSRADSSHRAHRVRRQAAQRAPGHAGRDQHAPLQVRRSRSDGRSAERRRRRHLRARQRRDGRAARGGHSVFDHSGSHGRQRRGGGRRRVADRSPAGFGAGVSDGAALQRQSAAKLEGGGRAGRRSRHLHAGRPRGGPCARARRGRARSPKRPASWCRGRRAPTSRSWRRRSASCRRCPRCLPRRCS